jgi:hypothetical protein
VKFGVEIDGKHTSLHIYFFPPSCNCLSLGNHISQYPGVGDIYSIVAPTNRNGRIILCVGNIADEKFQAFNEVSRLKFLGTVIHRLTGLLPNHCQHREIVCHNHIFE